MHARANTSELWCINEILPAQANAMDRESVVGTSSQSPNYLLLCYSWSILPLHGGVSTKSFLHPLPSLHTPPSDEQSRANIKNTTPIPQPSILLVHNEKEITMFSKSLLPFIAALMSLVSMSSDFVVVVVAVTTSSADIDIDERFDLDESGVDPFGLAFNRLMNPKQYLVELVTASFGSNPFSSPPDDMEEDREQPDVVDIQGVLIGTPPETTEGAGTVGTRRLQDRNQLFTPSRPQRSAFPTNMPTFVQSDIPSDMPSIMPSDMPSDMPVAS